MAKTTRRPAAKARPIKSARTRSAPSSPKPKPTPSTETAAAPVPAYEVKRRAAEARAAAIALRADKTTWVTASKIRENLAEEDKRRFAELCSLPLPSKLAAELTDRKRLFCYEVFRDGKQQAACIRAGFAVGRSQQTAYKLMQESGVRLAIDWLADAAAAQDETSVEWIVHQLKAIYEVCRGVVPALDTHGKALGTFKIDAGGALRALELIGKLRGGFTQVIKHEHSGSVTHLLQAIAGTGKPALEDRQAIDVTPSHEPVGVDVGVDSDES